jgi:hypothetical protein
MPAKSLRIESVENLSSREDVWDITVPGGEHFTLGNGAIVHNSADAFRTGAVMLPDIMPKMHRPPQWSDHLTFEEMLKHHDKVVEKGRSSSARSFTRL